MVNKLTEWLRFSPLEQSDLVDHITESVVIKDLLTASLNAESPVERRPFQLGGDKLRQLELSKNAPELSHRHSADVNAVEDLEERE